MACDSVERVLVDQEQVIIPDLTIKDLLSAIPYVDVSSPLTDSISHPFCHRAHCFKRNGWRSSLYVCVSFSFVRWHTKSNAYIPPVSQILPPWLLSTRLLLSSMPTSILKSSISHTRSFTAPQNSRFGLYIPSGLVSSPPAFGLLPMNVVTRPTPSPSWSTTPLAGSFIPGMRFHRSYSILFGCINHPSASEFHTTRGVSPMGNTMRLLVI